MATTIFDDLQVMHNIIGLQPHFGHIVSHLSAASARRLATMPPPPPPRPASKALLHASDAPPPRQRSTSSSQLNACSSPGMPKRTDGSRIGKIRSYDSIRSNLASTGMGMRRRTSGASGLCNLGGGSANDLHSDAQYGEPAPLATPRTAGTDAEGAMEVDAAVIRAAQPQPLPARGLTRRAASDASSSGPDHARGLFQHVPELAEEISPLGCHVPPPPIGVSEEEMGALVALLLAQHPQGVIEPLPTAESGPMPDGDTKSESDTDRGCDAAAAACPPPDMDGNSSAGSAVVPQLLGNS
mmetsp:Transcript_10149/g.26334  ORF Transcript_10149/g.26334 Transcript_10149/m.26334 type:complete len:298 (-) Transcript_10149:127-1020(-)